MNKEETFWKAGEIRYDNLEDVYTRCFTIDNRNYNISEDAAAICHSILLLKESISRLQIL